MGVVRFAGSSVRPSTAIRRPSVLQDRCALQSRIPAQRCARRSSRPLAIAPAGTVSSSESTERLQHCWGRSVDLDVCNQWRSIASDRGIVAVPDGGVQGGEAACVRAAFGSLLDGAGIPDRNADLAGRFGRGRGRRRRLGGNWSLHWRLRGSGCLHRRLASWQTGTAVSPAGCQSLIAHDETGRREA